MISQSKALEFDGFRFFTGGYMAKVYGTFGPTFNTVPSMVEAILKPVFKVIGQWKNCYQFDSHYADQLSQSFRNRIANGEAVYLLGLSPSSHNTGAALVKCSTVGGIEVISNDEEERFTGIKHCENFPIESLKEISKRLQAMDLSFADIHGVCLTWDFPRFIPIATKILLQHAPLSLMASKEGASDGLSFKKTLEGFETSKHLMPFFNATKPVVSMHHHKNHAYFSYAASPFCTSRKSTLIAVMDGFGESGAISLYSAQGGDIRNIAENNSYVDSLGALYGIISSTQGGWKLQSSEGRYMGAAAWGNMNRLTNQYYRRLREIVHFADEGNIFINRSMSGWQYGGIYTPYKRALTEVLGDPIPLEKMWNPDVVLNLDEIKHADITRDRVDKAAALQMVFEDAIFHVVDYWIRKTGVEQLVLSGGTALNCLANMKLLEQFDEAYYLRYLNKKTYLSLWIPPTPGDAGVAMGAAIQFAMLNGVKPVKSCMPHPFICGVSPCIKSIEDAIAHIKSDNYTDHPDTAKKKEDTRILKYRRIGNLNDPSVLNDAADFMAYAISQDGVIGIYQGSAETGPRALGHRSILANPFNPNTLDVLNTRVKIRERIRPLAPMLTLECAAEYFDLSLGASQANYDAYRYMILTVMAKENAHGVIPAVIHKDGTARIQIVREEDNPLIHAYLKAMGRIAGAEVSVNTSLNVGSPIVQTPLQALEVLYRARGLDGLIMVASNGDVVCVWLEGISTHGHLSRLDFWLHNYKLDRSNCAIGDVVVTKVASESGFF